MTTIELTSSQRKYLRGLAHHSEPVVQIGQKGISDALVAETSNALDSHELIKVKFVEHKEERKELAQDLSMKLECHLVGLIGNVAILYRQQEDRKLRQISLPKPGNELEI